MLNVPREKVEISEFAARGEKNAKLIDSKPPEAKKMQNSLTQDRRRRKKSQNSLTETPPERKNAKLIDEAKFLGVFSVESMSFASLARRRRENFGVFSGSQ